MTFEEIYNNVAKTVPTVNLEDYKDNLIIQINFIREITGSFYIKIDNSKATTSIGVSPVSDVQITITGADFIKILNRQLNPMIAIALGKIKIQGDVSKLQSLQHFIKK